MGSLNVNRSVADAFYRYKMPRICAKVEGKGNGIKTVIVNMAEVAKALGRPATYPTKYFGCELGAQTQFDFKNERFIVNGSHDSAKLQDLLDGFIRKFVLCPECDNPETELLVSTKRNTISQGCKACGYHGQLDFNHKLNTFILKNPPQACNTQGASLTEGNRGKRSKRSGPATNGHDESKDGESNNSSEKESSVSTNGGGKAVKTPSPTDGPVKKKSSADEEDEDGWTVDVSEEAVRARMQDLTEGAKNMTLTEDSEKNEKERMDLFYAFLKDRVRNNKVQGTKHVSEIVQEAERLEVKGRAALVAMEVLVREGSLATDVRTHRPLLVRLTLHDPRAQRHALYAVDALCHHSPTALAKVPALLKLLYDSDIVEEKSIIEWASKPSRKYAPREVAADVRKRAAPFLEWLAAAESEEDENNADEPSEDELEIEYSDRLSTPVRGPAPPRTTLPDEGIDVDIDAI